MYPIRAVEHGDRNGVDRSGESVNLGSMSGVTRVGDGLRSRLLATASDLLLARGYRRLRMTDVAAAAGVSRQTLYNELGDKEQLVGAVLLHRTAEFLDEIDSAMRRADATRDGVRAAVLAALRHAEREPLVVALVSGAASDLLPFLADRHAGPVLHAVTDSVDHHLQRLWPGSEHRAVATAVVRLAVSHMLLPTTTPDVAATEVADVAIAVLRDGGESIEKERP